MGLGGVQAGLLVIEAGFLFAQSFFILMLLFAIGELALFAGQAPCSECSATWAVGFSNQRKSTLCIVQHHMLMLLLAIHWRLGYSVSQALCLIALASAQPMQSQNGQMPEWCQTPAALSLGRRRLHKLQLRDCLLHEQPLLCCLAARSVSTSHGFVSHCDSEPVLHASCARPEA